MISEFNTDIRLLVSYFQSGPQISNSNAMRTGLHSTSPHLLSRRSLGHENAFAPESRRYGLDACAVCAS